MLHICDSLNPRYGGPAKAVVDLCKHGAMADLEVEFVSFGEDREHWNIGFPVQCFRTKKFALFHYPVGLGQWLKANLHRFSGVVIHSMWVEWGWVTARECRRSGIPYSYFPHGMLEPWSVERQGFAKRLKKVLYWYLRERHIVTGAKFRIP